MCYLHCLKSELKVSKWKVFDDDEEEEEEVCSVPLFVQPAWVRASNDNGTLAIDQFFNTVWVCACVCETRVHFPIHRIKPISSNMVTWKSCNDTIYLFRDFCGYIYGKLWIYQPQLEIIHSFIYFSCRYTRNYIYVKLSKSCSLSKLRDSGAFFRNFCI